MNILKFHFDLETHLLFTSHLNSTYQIVLNKGESLTKLEIADSIGIYDERIIQIFHEELCMKKLFGELVQLNKNCPKSTFLSIFEADENTNEFLN